MILANDNGKFEMSHPEFSLEQVLDLACAAQRINNAYIKQTEFVYDSEMKPLYRKEPNKFLMLFTLGLEQAYDEQYRPQPLNVIQADREQAEEIRKFFRRYMFGAVAGDNEFQTEVNSILSSETVARNKFGFIACLPSVMERDKQRLNQTRSLKSADNEPLGMPGDVFTDLDCEIVSSRHSENYDAWNICAIINNRIVSWFSKTELKTGPCVVVKAKIKIIGENWHTKKIETRLNYVKAAQ
jgi:hypothetical protein